MTRKIAEAACVLLTGEPKDAAALKALVDGCGGWSGVIAEWREIGGEHEVLACVWEIRGVLSAEAELVAEQLGVEEAFVRRFVWDLEEHVTRGRLAEAAALAAWIAEVLAEHLAGSGDAVVEAGAAWWLTRWEVLRSAKGGVQSK